MFRPICYADDMRKIQIELKFMKDNKDQRGMFLPCLRFAIHVVLSLHTPLDSTIV